jgi:hypothetical protein
MVNRPDVEYPARVVEPLGRPLKAHTVTTSAASKPVALTPGTRRLTMRALTASARYAIGPAPQVASATSHYIAADERLDIAIRVDDVLAVIQGSGAGTIEISEMGFS